MPWPMAPGVFGIEREMLRASGNAARSVSSDTPARHESMSLSRESSLKAGYDATRSLRFWGLHATTTTSESLTTFSADGLYMMPYSDASFSPVPSGADVHTM
eukprot:Amastigsp_a182198_13.p3 type:complete len:102 gc:universal Amastigsp_a182198_13:440-135(-)